MSAVARDGTWRASVGALVAIVIATVAGAADRPRILVTNDDGIDAPGLAALVEALAGLGDVTVVAPLENQSGIGHALTLRGPLFVARRSVAGVEATGVSATPASVVRMALGHLLRDAPPRLVVSGVNRGLNFGRNAYISGTVAAAREAALTGVPAIAASLDYPAHPDYRRAAELTAEVARRVLAAGLPDGVFLNVNVPGGADAELRWTRQSRQRGLEQYEERRSPQGARYVWNSFVQPTEPAEPGSDVRAVQDGFAAVCPLHASEAGDAALAALGASLGVPSALAQR